MSDEIPVPDRFSKAKLLEALAVEPVFEFLSRGLGTIHVTAMRVNTLEKIVFEFEKSDADDNSRLRRLLREIGQTENGDGILEAISKDRAAEVTDDELLDFARHLLVSEEWATQEEAAQEADPKGRVVAEIRKQMEQAGSAYKTVMDSLGSSISAITRSSILDSSLIADRVRADAFASSKVIKSLQEEHSRIAGIGKSMGNLFKPHPAFSAVDEQVRRLRATFPHSPEPVETPSIPPLANFVNPAIESARSTAKSAANLEEAFERLEQRANDSAVVIVGIHDIIRNTTLDMAKNALESAASTKQALDQAAASIAIGAQSLKWAKYALIASVVIGLIGLALSGASVWYTVHPVAPPSPAIETSARATESTKHAPASTQELPAQIRNALSK
ncbi:hypothetical protein LMG29542_08329 [Paraburkholderia humisilvae]|uniref:Uncharacterized protein n=2 Tax=Paraburkholderia humisilvae TaxID=627669 RepID=A0A6J5FBV4_9BURK|nr:hypothetical protein LMG29542_08329 [Paraburkholderia humisilvae]